MALLQLSGVRLAFGGPAILDGVDFQIDEGERVCLVGRNGAGKTTLLRVLTGEEAPSAGDIIQRPNLFVSRLPQEIPDDITGPVIDVIGSGVPAERNEEPWEIDRRVERLADEMELPLYVDFESLSGGVQRRVLLARALAGDPDVLVLDEPTNHLDIASIERLEAFLLSRRIALFFVTHDRAFLRRLATRIVELDRGKLSSWACDYTTFLERRNAALEAEEKQWAAFDKKLAQEEAWLRQGVKARRTRNEGRVQALKKLRNERSARRQREGAARLALSEGSTSGQKVLEAKNVSFAYQDHPIIQDFSTIIWRGDKVGVIGPNGSGKSTLLKLLLGELTPSSGEVRLGSNLQIVYLDQLRDLIDDSKTVAENVAGNAETVTFQGRPVHIFTYLRDFLFTADRIRQPAKSLSGGERNRLLLARLFLQPANLLVMDEPTNDLDAETLELLEELLVSFAGTLVLVSHDREFLDGVVTATLSIDSDGRVSECVGGYADWLEMQARTARPTPPGPEPTALPAKREKVEKPRKFLNRDRAELNSLPAKIEQMEAEHAALANQLGSPELYVSNPERLPEIQRAMDAIHAEVAKAYARWEELEALRIEIEGVDSGG